MPQLPTLLADIGGTNARFAITERNAPWFSHEHTMKCEDHTSIFAAIDTYLECNNIHELNAICFAVAGQIKNQTMSFINNDWSITGGQLQDRYKTAKVALLNDFEAIAISLTELSDTDLVSIGEYAEPLTEPNYTVAVLGPGSGLGVGVLRSSSGELDAIASEGGHISFAPGTTLQSQILDYLQSSIGRVSNERLLSGPGLVNIHAALCHINQYKSLKTSAADISRCASDNGDAMCVETMNLFFEILGQVAGDTALMFDAYDGIFIGGGIAQRFPSQLKNSAFRRGFENKGRHSDLMRSVPSWLIMHNNAGLLGASRFARQNLL